jgi:hypothetical protein
MLVDRTPHMPEAESLALPLRGPKHAPVARFRVLLLVVPCEHRAGLRHDDCFPRARQKRRTGDGPSPLDGL